MGFESLLGNERIKENLQCSLSKGHASHFYMVSGPAGSGKNTLARLLSAALMCESGEKTCMKCNTCRKILSGTHPDCITVTDPEHKHVAVKLVRQIRDDMFIRPNEGNKKIYIFPQELGVEGQNALLKILEEPPSYGVFLLLTENAQQLLPTVRSRCVQLALQPLPEAILRQELSRRMPEAEEAAIQAAISRSGGFLGQALALLEDSEQLPQTRDFLQAFALQDGLLLTQVLEDSNAHLCGLEEGDILLAVNGQPLQTCHQLHQMLLTITPAAAVELTIFRTGQTFTVHLPVEIHP